MRKYINKRSIIILSVILLVATTSVSGYVISRTKNRVQVEFNIHINQQAVYLSTYSEPPQFAVWLEDLHSGKCQQVFVTYRASRGDWEGKADVPALPQWKNIFRDGGTQSIASDEEITISGATPKDEYFRVRAEVSPDSKWICWIEMNLAGDYNEFYPYFNTKTMEEDEFAIGQPAIMYRAEINAEEGLEFKPIATYMSLWKKGSSSLISIDETITTAKDVFDEVTISIIKPKPVIINKRQVESQEVLNEKP